MTWLELSKEAAVAKRHQLVRDGYCIIPGMMEAEILEELRAFSADVFRRLPVDDKYRYQGSDIHVFTPQRFAELGHEHNERMFDDEIVERVVRQPRQLEVSERLGLEELVADDAFILLSKPPHGPPLYWHQDFTNWNSPEAAAPWPTRIFFSYYLLNTNRENGCLRVIPGSHRRRLDLHDTLPDAHSPEIQALKADTNHPAFMDREDAIDVPLQAGDLIIGDARIMHGAWPNETYERRTLVLTWYRVFARNLTPPSWWNEKLPEALNTFDPEVNYSRRRTPSEFIG
ncbi:MAG: phytanoyl-CoA dioxygenase family protein [Candidatus Latescibacterota bacterium]|nr:phytanoyl-CoA dioxygenase family protein [Candidatus Latescibacterota bacterium]